MSERGRHAAIMLPIGKFLRGDAMAQHGEFAEGIAQMREGIKELRSMGTLASLPICFASAADACARCGNIDDGLAMVEEGLERMRTGGERFSLPEIHRIKGSCYSPVRSITQMRLRPLSPRHFRLHAHSRRSCLSYAPP